jgi:hypothetical protein
VSWIVRDLWSTLDARHDEYSGPLETDRIQAFQIIDRIAAEVGERWSVVLQLNFPPGQQGPGSQNLGRRDLTILVDRNRRKFDDVREADARNAFRSLNPVGFDQIGGGYEGFKVKLSSGRIDCLPSGVHIWCEITLEVLRVLDSLFTNVYGGKRSTIAPKARKG